MARGEDGQMKERTDNSARAADDGLLWQIAPCISQSCSLAWVPGTEPTTPTGFFGSFVVFSLFSLSFQINTHLRHFA